MAQQSSRTIVGLMGAAVVFSLIGNEVAVAQGKQNAKLPNGLKEGGTILLGGTIATVLLVLISKAGEPGHALGVGLAAVTLGASALIYGKPVWDTLRNVTGGTPPTTPLGTTTTPTPATTPPKKAAA